MKSQSSELHQLWKLAIPLMAVNLGNRLMGFVDMAILGRVGKVELAAGGVGNAVFFAGACVGMGTVLGLDPMISQSLGAGRPERARQWLWQGIWLATLAALLLAGPIYAAAGLLSLFGIEDAVASEAQSYIAIRLVGLAPYLSIYAVRAYIQAASRARIMVLAVVVGNLVNAGATYLLVHGGGVLPEWTGFLRGIPAFGVPGSAAATVLAQLVQLSIFVQGVPKAPPEWVIDRRPRAEDLWKSAKMGLPIGLHIGAEVGVFTLMGLLAGSLGTAELAAHQVALSLASLSFVCCIGLAEAGSVRVGKAIGAKDTPRARRAGFLAVASAAGLMAGSATLFLLAPEVVTGLVTDNPEVLAVAMSLLGVAAVFQISDGIQAAGSGILRGTGDTRFAFWANMLGHYVVGLPVALLLTYVWGFGVTGLWWGLCAGLSAVAVALVLRFAKISSAEIAPMEP